MPEPLPPAAASTQHNTPSAEVIREFNDRGTLWLLEDPVHLRDLLQILEPELAGHLDVERAERVNRSFIPADLLKEESDLIFRIPFRADTREGASEVLIYVLLEHQSKPDPLMGLRLFLYVGELWDTQLREWRDATRGTPLRLLPVIPIVFYTGAENWITPIDLAGLMNLPPELERFVPKWDTLFLNLHRMPPDTLTHFDTAVGYALQALQAEREPLAELERVLKEALAGLEGLTEEQSGQWVRVAWYLVLLAYHRRERPEYNELVQLIRAEAKGSKFRERTEVENMAETMAQWAEKQAQERVAQAQETMAQWAEKQAQERVAQAQETMAQWAENQAQERVAQAQETMAQWAEKQASEREARARVESRLDGARAMLVRLGSKRFGVPDARSRTALDAMMSAEAIEGLVDRVLDVESWQELLA